MKQIQQLTWLYVLCTPAHWQYVGVLQQSPHPAVICHSMLTTKRFMIRLNNPSPCFKVSYTNGTAPRRASECLLSPYHLRRQCLLQQGNAWLYNMPPCSGSRAEIDPGESRFTSAQGLASCSCGLLWTTRVFPRKPMRVSWDQKHKTAQRPRLKMQKITKLRVE